MWVYSSYGNPVLRKAMLVYVQIKVYNKTGGFINRSLNSRFAAIAT